MKRTTAFSILVVKGEHTEVTETREGPEDSSSDYSNKGLESWEEPDEPWDRD